MIRRLTLPRPDPQPRPGSGPLAAVPRPAGNGQRHRGPVIVLTYAHAGAGRLRSLLGEHPDLACTSGTGLLPLCEQASLTWQQAEGRAEAAAPPSALALASIRALTGTIITSVLAREGKTRWCEIATAPAACAQTFLDIYPDTRFLCLHRNCADVIRSAVQASPWGISDLEFGRFATAYPGRGAAILAAYWCAQAGPMLDFQAAHPGICSQVRYEDLTRDPDLATRDIFTFLGLDHQNPAVPAWITRDSTPDTDPAAPPPIPLEQIPPALRTHADELLTRLSYHPLT
jgi:sulfotransferase family protein